MTLQDVKDELTLLLSGKIDLNDALQRIIEIKQEFVKKNKQEEAKRLWCYEKVIEIHISWNKIFWLLKEEKKYYDAWCELERCEIDLINLAKHYSYENNQFGLNDIERRIKDLQTIYPYRFFMSTEILEEETRCSICDSIVSIKKSCGHKLGEIYNGEMCYRVVSKCKLLGVALVENPVHKYAVLFTVDPDTNEQKDHYNYYPIDYLFTLIESPYDYWKLEVRQELIPHEEYSHYDKEAMCPCGEMEKYKDCCLLTEGVVVYHYQFILANAPNNGIPSEVTFTNTVKNN